MIGFYCQQKQQLITQEGNPNICFTYMAPTVPPLNNLFPEKQFLN